MHRARIRTPTFAACLLAGAVAADAADRPDRRAWPRVMVQEPSARHALYAALEGASRWLAQPGCQELFTHFRDQQGRELQERLADLEVDAGDYLRMILFVDGRDLETCQRGSALAVTAPGSRVVFVCSNAFAREWSRQARHATAVPVHEALHSLGLAENPPSSSEITTEVLRRCNR